MASNFRVYSITNLATFNLLIVVVDEDRANPPILQKRMIVQRNSTLGGGGGKTSKRGSVLGFSQKIASISLPVLSVTEVRRGARMLMAVNKSLASCKANPM